MRGLGAGNWKARVLRDVVNGFFFLTLLLFLFFSLRGPWETAFNLFLSFLFCTGNGKLRTEGLIISELRSFHWASWDLWERHWLLGRDFGMG